MSIDKVRNEFRKKGIADRIIELDSSTATVSLAAAALKVEEGRIAKTMSFITKDGPILIVTAGDVRIDNHAYKELFHVKARMIAPEDVESIIGHRIGGVCPFAVNEGVKIYLDDSLRRFSTVFPACGSENSAIELSLDELQSLSGSSEWINVTKD